MKKEISFLTKLTAINFLILSFYIPYVLGATINYPQTVFPNQTFNATITHSIKTTSYDVKIFVKSQDGKIISQIYDERWKSGNYYILNSYPNKSNYQISVNKNTENATICLRLREHSKTKFIETCDSIKIKESNQEINKIYLNTPKNKETFTSFKSKSTTVILFSFLIFAFVILLLIVIKKL